MQTGFFYIYQKVISINPASDLDFLLLLKH